MDTILTSDHKPVFATFDVSIIGQFVSSKGASADNSGDVKIVFEEIKVEVSPPTLTWLLLLQVGDSL